MDDPELKPLDRRLLLAGHVIAVIGYGVLLIGVSRTILAWQMARDRSEVAVVMLWLFSFSAFGVALINSGNRLGRAYRAGMQAWF